MGIIAVEIMPVSFRITHHALAKQETCAEIKYILNYHKWDKVVLVAHSYGTTIATHLLKDPSTADLVGPMVLIDPVTILLHLPDVAYNFKHRRPKHANEHQLHYFAAMDMGVSHTLSRRFFWSENVLWKEDLHGKNVTVSLAGQDLIANTEAVGRYLALGSTSGATCKASSRVTSVNVLADGEILAAEVEINSNAVGGRDDAWKSASWKGKGVDVLWFENLDHGQVFDRKETRQALLTVIRAYCADAL